MIEPSRLRALWRTGLVCLGLVFACEGPRISMGHDDAEPTVDCGAADCGEMPDGDSSLCEESAMLGFDCVENEMGACEWRANCHPVPSDDLMAAPMQ